MKKTIKSESNKSVRCLREIIGKTQDQFASMVGVSTDTVRSWELGRNTLKLSSARRIGAQTGANVACLLAGNGKVLDAAGNPYSKEHFENWTTGFGRGGKKRSDYWFEYSAELMQLLYTAAGMPDSRNKDRLAAFHMSILETMQRAYEDFKLAPQVSEVLNKNKPKGSPRVEWTPLV